MSPEVRAPSPPVSTLLAQLVLPTRPDPEAAEEEPAPGLVVPAAAALLGIGSYGALAGLFQGAGQVPLAALKALLVVGLTLALCLPSLWLMLALSGETWSGRRLAGAALSFAGALGLSLAALAPVCWLFSVSSRSLGSLISIHLLAWIVALALSRRSLRARTGPRGGFALAAWALLFFLVSLQSATYLQPLLFRAPGEAAFPRPRQLFLDHLVHAARVELPAPAEPAR
jgi:hypothetical protein